jgi:hypothetical protein
MLWKYLKCKGKKKNIIITIHSILKSNASQKEDIYPEFKALLEKNSILLKKYYNLEI